MINISIIVPVYNAGKKLNKCINSIIDQTYKDFEVILINDGSTDNSLEICEKYKKKDNRIKIINKNNQGSVWARKLGLEMATGKYIVFVDADDWIHKQLLEILYDEAEMELCDIVACNSYIVYGNGLIKRTRNDFNINKTYENKDIKKYILNKFVGDTGFPTSLWAKIYRKDLFENYGEYFLKMKFFGEDLALNMELLTKCNKVKVINKPLYYYRCGGGTTKYMKDLFDDIITTYYIQKDCIDKYYPDEIEKRYSKVAFIFLNTYKLVLVNMFASGIEKSEMISKIEEQIKNTSILDASKNLKETREWFDDKYIDAVDSHDCEYLYNLAKYEYKKSRYKTYIKNILIKLNI